MYHNSTLGTFAGNVKRYADMRGYVPELGDEHEDMEWDGDWTPETWQEHVEAADAATKDAEAAIAAWRAK